MNDSQPSPAAPQHSGGADMAEQLNNDDNSLSNHLQRISLTTAASTALPPSSPAGPRDTNRHDSPSASSRSTRTPIRRTPSSSSLGGNEKPSPSAILTRPSMSSLKDGGGITPPRSPAPRRSSSYFHNLSMGDRSSLPPPVEEAPKPPATSASIAHDFFEKELEVKHESSEVLKSSQTVVILQDACYGHRYSRPKTSKNALSTIVERPERIHASLLGVATAYVRLGGRHAAGTAPPHPQRDPVSLPPAPFKIHKTPRTLSLRSPAAAVVHGKEWMEELTIMCDKAESKLSVNGKELTREDIDGQPSEDTTTEKAELHAGDLYLCSESLNALEGALGGVCEGVDAVFSDKGPTRAFVCIRPPGHHCAADMPSGFCWINNVHVGIGHAAITHGLTHAAIIDFDLHHGDGSQSITWDHNARVASLPKNTPMTKKTPIGYFSLHDINSYPCEMGDEEKVRNASLCIENAHGQSIWNVHLQPWKTISEFWALYEDRYLVLLAKARAFLKAHSDRLRQSPTHPNPKAAIFLSAGFDASEWESPGMQRHQVHVPTEFYAHFTQDVVKMAEEESLGVDGRVISVLEGGYSDRALMSGILSHISGLATNISLSRPSTSESNGAGQEIRHHVSSSALTGGSPQHTKSAIDKGQGMQYDSAWWSVPYLEELETLIDPRAHVALVPKGPRGNVQPTFTMPTESFISKVVEAPQGRRSTSGTARPTSSVIPRAPSPPPPEVGWATASLELRNLLVPSGRETRSCRPEDLNAEATRKRRDRQSNLGLTELPIENPPTDAKSIKLREKRAKAPEIKEEEQKAVSRASRRKTIADPKLLAKEGTPPPLPIMTRPVRRRSSAASSIVSVGTMNTDRVSDFGLPPMVEEREPLAVKKARLSEARRAEAMKPKAAVKRPAPATRKPSTTSTITTPSTDQLPLANGKTSISAGDEAKDEDLAQLSSGMRGMSIRLKVPPRDEHEARDQKSKPAPRGRPPKATTAKTTKARSPTKSKTKIPFTTTQPVSFPTLSKSTMQAMQPTQPEQIFQAPTTDPVPSAGSAQEPYPHPQLPNGTLAHGILQVVHPSTQETQPPPPITESTAKAQNTPKPPPQAPSPAIHSFSDIAPPFSPITPTQPATPITAKRSAKGNLPVFTATSPISFSKAKQSGGIYQALQAANRPPDLQPIHSDLAGKASPAPNITTVPSADSYISGSGLFQPPPSEPSVIMEGPNDQDNGVKTTPQESSIWDVPDMP